MVEIVSDHLPSILHKAAYSPVISLIGVGIFTIVIDILYLPLFLIDLVAGWLGCLTAIAFVIVLTARSLARTMAYPGSTLSLQKEMSGDYIRRISAQLIQFSSIVGNNCAALILLFTRKASIDLRILETEFQKVAMVRTTVCKLHEMLREVVEELKSDASVKAEEMISFNQVISSYESILNTLSVLCEAYQRCQRSGDLARWCGNVTAAAASPASRVIPASGRDLLAQAKATLQVCETMKTVAMHLQPPQQRDGEQNPLSSLIEAVKELHTKMEGFRRLSFPLMRQVVFYRFGGEMLQLKGKDGNTISVLYIPSTSRWLAHRTEQARLNAVVGNSGSSSMSGNSGGSGNDSSSYSSSAIAGSSSNPNSVSGSGSGSANSSNSNSSSVGNEGNGGDGDPSSRSPNANLRLHGAAFDVNSPPPKSRASPNESQSERRGSTGGGTSGSPHGASLDFGGNAAGGAASPPLHGCSEVGTVLFCCPNAGMWECLSNANMEISWLGFYLTLGFDFCVFNYRGYGLSDGVPDPTRCKSDGEVVYRYLTNVRKVKNVLVHGESIGGLVAAHLGQLFGEEAGRSRSDRYSDQACEPTASAQPRDLFQTEGVPSPGVVAPELANASASISIEDREALLKLEPPRTVRLLVCDRTFGSLDAVAGRMLGTWAGVGLRVLGCWNTAVMNDYHRTRCHKVLIQDPCDEVIMNAASLKSTLALRVVFGDRTFDSRTLPTRIRMSDYLGFPDGVVTEKSPLFEMPDIATNSAKEVATIALTEENVIELYAHLLFLYRSWKKAARAAKLKERNRKKNGNLGQFLSENMEAPPDGSELPTEFQESSQTEPEKTTQSLKRFEEDGFPMGKASDLNLNDSLDDLHSTTSSPRDHIDSSHDTVNLGRLRSRAEKLCDCNLREEVLSIPELAWVAVYRIDAGLGQLLGETVPVAGLDTLRAWVAGSIAFSGGKACYDDSLPRGRTSLSRGIQDVNYVIDLVSRTAADTGDYRALNHSSRHILGSLSFVRSFLTTLSARIGPSGSISRSGSFNCRLSRSNTNSSINSSLSGSCHSISGDHKPDDPKSPSVLFPGPSDISPLNNGCEGHMEMVDQWGDGNGSDSSVGSLITVHCGHGGWPNSTQLHHLRNAIGKAGFHCEDVSV